MIDEQSRCTFEELGHTAEIGVRVRAGEPGELFACAAHAMFALMGAQPQADAPTVTAQVTLDAVDVESLLVDWLSELVYLHETTGAIFDDILIVDWSPTAMKGAVRGQKPRHPPHTHIKAVTYHELMVQPEGEGWVGQVYFDI